MTAHAVQRITEDQLLAYQGIEERFNAKVIPRAEKLSHPGIPNSKRKVTDQMLYAVCTPNAIGMQNEVWVRNIVRNRSTATAQFRNQFTTPINSRVSRDPDATIQAARLVLPLGFKRSAQECMAKSR